MVHTAVAVVFALAVPTAALHAAAPGVRCAPPLAARAAAPACAFERRAALCALGALLAASPAWANTQAEMDGTMELFDADEARRAAFLQKQKAYKKAWRKELANFEYSTTDAEALDSIKALAKMVRENGMEIPAGTRKMDLDQVYKRVKPNLSKGVRMAFQDFDRMVGSIVTVKDLRADDF